MNIQWGADTLLTLGTETTEISKPREFYNKNTVYMSAYRLPKNMKQNQLNLRKVKTPLCLLN